MKTLDKSVSEVYRSGSGSGPTLPQWVEINNDNKILKSNNRTFLLKKPTSIYNIVNIVNETRKLSILIESMTLHSNVRILNPDPDWHQN
jgi:hypothetical protein